MKLIIEKEELLVAIAPYLSDRGISFQVEDLEITDNQVVLSVDTSIEANDEPVEDELLRIEAETAITNEDRAKFPKVSIFG